MYLLRIRDPCEVTKLNIIIMKTLNLFFMTGLSLLILLSLFNAFNFFLEKKLEQTIIYLTVSCIAFFFLTLLITILKKEFIQSKNVVILLEPLTRF